MSGLLDGLRTFFLGDDGRLHEVESKQAILRGPWLRGSDVRDLLRSDETVERLSYIAGSAAAREFLAALAGGDQ